MKRVFVWAAAATMVAGCALSKQDAPALTGPSEFGLALAVSASPDVVTQDGKSQSFISVVARDANGQPVRGVSLRLAMFVDGASVDYGTLSSKSISTDNSGQASAIYTAPAPPPLTVTSDKTVEIQVLPEGSNFSNTTARLVTIRLARGGVILPPNPPLVPSFFFSPTQPHENDSVQFDASASTGVIVSYVWAFGDGSTGTGVRPTHTYGLSGVYNVILTLTDDRGVQASSAPTPVSVITSPDPIAKFEFSPQDPAVGDRVNFNASGSAAAAGRSIASYQWDFGDGQFGSGVTAVHIYGKANNYTVTLTVTDSTGRTGVTGVTSKNVQVK